LNRIRIRIFSSLLFSSLLIRNAMRGWCCHSTRNEKAKEGTIHANRSAGLDSTSSAEHPIGDSDSASTQSHSVTTRCVIKEQHGGNGIDPRRLDSAATIPQEILSLRRHFQVHLVTKRRGQRNCVFLQAHAARILPIHAEPFLFVAE
jgi:hypothetical protein